MIEETCRICGKVAPIFDGICNECSFDIEEDD